MFIEVWFYCYSSYLVYEQYFAWMLKVIIIQSLHKLVFGMDPETRVSLLTQFYKRKRPIDVFSDIRH